MILVSRADACRNVAMPVPRFYSGWHESVAAGWARFEIPVGSPGDRGYIDVPNAAGTALDSSGVPSPTSLFGVGDEAVTNAANGLEVAWAAWIVLEIPTEPHDEVVDGARVGVLPHAPHLLEDGLPRHRLALMLDQITEQ